MVTEDQKNVLLALIHNPGYNLNAIKSYLNNHDIKISYYSIQKAYNDLSSNNILRQPQMIHDPILPGNKREISAVEGNPDISKLGLKRHHVIFYNIPKDSTINNFFKLTDLHPYTRYRTLLLGHGLNAYAQFDIPTVLNEEMLEFYDKISEIIQADNYKIISSEFSTVSELQLSQFDLNKDSWHLDNYYDNSNPFEFIWENFSGSKNGEMVPERRKRTKFREIDLSLVRELSINYNVKAEDIHLYYNKDRTTISKYLNHIKNKYMSPPRLYYNRLKFDLSNPQMLMGSIKSWDSIQKLHSLFKSPYFPFRAEMISDKNHYLIVVMIPPSLSSEFGYFLWGISDWVENYTINLNPKIAIRYPFYNLPYNFEISEWRTSQDYLVNDVLIDFNSH